MSASHRPALESAIPDQWTDWFRLLRRHSALVAITLVASLLLGALYYLKAPRWYESTAEILIVAKHYGGFRDTSSDDEPVDQKAIETHIELLKSPMILKPALDSLKEVPRFLQDQEDPIAVLTDNLSVTLKNENSMVLLVKLCTPNPADSRALMDAIVHRYESYLGASAQQVGRETYELIAKAKDDLALQIRKTEQQRNEFRAQAPLLWENGASINIHHERQKAIEAQRNALIVESTTLHSKLAAIEKAMEQSGVSRDAVYYEALQELQLNEEDPALKALRTAESEQFGERETLRQSAALLMAEYVRLKVEQSELLDEFGAGHPQVESVATRLEEVRVMLVSLVKNQLPIEGVLAGDIEQTSAEKDYVRIYLQLLRDRRAILDRQLADLNDRFQEEQIKANEIAKYQHRDQELTNELTYATQLFENVVARVREIDLLQSYGGDTMTLIAAPQLGEQVSPRLLHVAIISLFSGILISWLLAWMVDASQKTYYSPQDLRNGLGVPIVGRVPVIPRAKRAPGDAFSTVDPIICTVHQERSLLSEAFRGVRTGLYFSGGAQHRVIQVTSPSPGDGKSTVVANLAVSIAHSGKRVALVDADFRRPTLEKLLGTPKGAKYGFASVIAQRASLQEAVLPTSIDNLYLLPALEIPKNPSEILSTARFDEVLAELREQFDYVLIDTPPILAVTDPCAMAARVDGVLLTVRIRKGIQVTGRRAMDMLAAVRANVLGVIINGVDDQWGKESEGYGSGHSYGYGYTYGYDDERSAADVKHANGNGKQRVPVIRESSTS